jgi:hypothetical protein
MTATTRTKTPITTLISWACPAIATLHIGVYTWIMRTAPQWLCTYHNANERVCGREHWDQRIEIAATAELVIAIACLGLSLLLFSRRLLSPIGKAGLALSCLLALLFGVLASQT